MLKGALGLSSEEKSLESIRTAKRDLERGRSKLISPEPQRKRYLTELLQGLVDRKITYAQFTGLDKKKLIQVGEMGYVKLKHGRLDEARKIFEVLSFIDHNNYFHHLALGSAYQKQKKWVDAVYQYTQALKINAQNTNALVNRGEVYLRNKNYRKAAEDFREAILLDQEGRDRFANRARSLVIAIKRLLARDKENRDLPKPLSHPKKPVPPLKMMGTSRLGAPRRRR